jgi:HEAT repeat protein
MPMAGPRMMPAYAYGYPPVPFNPMMQVPGRDTVQVAETPSASVPQLLAMLKDALYPSQREEAADRLAALGVKAHPAILDNLLAAAKEDPAATVRASCVRSLARLNVDRPDVIAAIQALKSDKDEHVRQEANQALLTLRSALPARVDDGIQPVSAVMPK